MIYKKFYYFQIARACTIVVAYILLKYHWNLNYALQYCSLCFPDMNIKQHLLKQLKSFAQRHSIPERDIFQQDIDYNLDSPQELVLRNTVNIYFFLLKKILKKLINFFKSL